MVVSWLRIHLQCRRPLFDSWVRNIPWRRDRLLTPVFLGFPCGSAGRVHLLCGRPGFDPWVGNIPWRGKATYSSILAWIIPWTVYSSWGHNEQDTTERLSLSEEVSILFFYFRIYDLGLLFSCSVVSNSLQPPAARQAYLSFTISQNFLKFMSFELMMPSNHLILYCPLLLLSSIFPSNKVFSNQSVFRIMWPKY